MADKIINVTEWMREKLDDMPGDITSDEREVLAYLSMAIFKMHLMSETSHQWSESFKGCINEMPEGFTEIIG